MAFVDHTYGGRVLREGIMPVKITLTDTCHVGDLIGYDNIAATPVWKRADADGKIPAQLIAGERCNTSGDEITCFKMAYVDFGSGCTATSGNVVYLSNTAGRYAAVPGSWVHQAVGQMISTREAFICVSSTPLTAFSTTGRGYAAYIRAELASGVTKASIFGGMRVDCKVIDGALGLNADVYGGVITVQFQDTDMSGLGAVLRLEDNSSAGCGGEAFVAMHGGGGDSPDFTFYFNPQKATSSCWDAGGTTPSVSTTGYIKCKFGGLTKLIKLWDS